jgi:hypothetical protein
MVSLPNFCPEVEAYYMPALEKFATLLNGIASPEAQNRTHGEIEQLLWTKGMELLRLAFQGHLNQRSSSEEKLKALNLEDGTSRTHGRKGCEKQLETRFGTVEVSRIGYEGPNLNRLFPMDEALNLPMEKYSHGLQGVVADQVVEGAFDSTKGHLDRLGGGRIPKRQIEDLAVKLGRDFESFYELPLYPGPTFDNDLLVLTFDGKGIVMLPDGLRDGTRERAKQEEGRSKKKRRLNPGEKGNRKRMATVASVYDVAPHPRTPEQIFFNKEEKDENSPPRPKPKNKRVWASVADSLQDVVHDGFQEAERRDPNHERIWVVLIDGQEDLIRQVETCKEIYRNDTLIVQDFVHTLEYLWKAAHALYDTDDEAEDLEKWIGKRGKRLLEGGAQAVASGLRRAASRRGLRAEKAKPALKAAEYIEKNQSRMRYDEAIRLGLPIATGVIEGACRHLVKDRMDITGARWSLERAEAILKLRAIKISGDLDAYLNFHFEQEKKRNYFPSMNSKTE